jgi:hypothetical protein
MNDGILIFDQNWNLDFYNEAAKRFSTIMESLLIDIKKLTINSSQLPIKINHEFLRGNQLEITCLASPGNKYMVILNEKMHVNNDSQNWVDEIEYLGVSLKNHLITLVNEFDSLAGDFKSFEVSKKILSKITTCHAAANELDSQLQTLKDVLLLVSNESINSKVQYNYLETIKSAIKTFNQEQGIQNIPISIGSEHSNKFNVLGNPELIKFIVCNILRIIKTNNLEQMQIDVSEIDDFIRVKFYAKKEIKRYVNLSNKISPVNKKTTNNIVETKIIKKVIEVYKGFYSELSSDSAKEFKVSIPKNYKLPNTKNALFNASKYSDIQAML